MLIAFYILAFLTVLGALSVLLMRSPVYCALSLVATFFLLAVIFVLLNNEFVAAIQVLIYAGAIMVLFLFVIMLLNMKVEGPLNLHLGVPQILGIGFTVALLAQLLGVLYSPLARMGPLSEYPPERIVEEGSVEIVGTLLFTEYVLPFEVISVLLMVAIMGAVILAKRRPQESVEPSDRPEEGP